MYGKNTQKYIDIILDSVKRIIRRDLMNEEEEQKYGQALMNILANKDGPCTVDSPIKPEDIFFGNILFLPLSEIISSYTALKNIPIYIRTFPYRKYNISPLDYLRYHIENYINDLTILRNRLIAYCNKINNAYKKTSYYGKVAKHTKKLRKIVFKYFERYCDIRDSHVHQIRYSDNDMDRLFAFDVLSHSNDKKFVGIINLFYEDSYKTIRKRWVKRIESDLKVINDLFEYYFNRLYDAITKDDNLLIN